MVSRSTCTPQVDNPFKFNFSGPQYFGLIPGWANPTGVALLVILVVMVVCSMKWVRKGGYFEVRPKFSNKCPPMTSWHSHFEPGINPIKIKD